MGKLAGVVAVVLLGGGVSVGGVFLSGIFSLDSTLPRNLNEFRKGNGGGCFQSLFSGINSMSDSSVADVSAESGPRTGFFDSSKIGQSDGCLVVNWNKEEYKGTQTRWRGDFRFLWAVKQENKGFVTFTTAETKRDESGNKLLWKGMAYSLVKESNGWKLSEKKTVDSTDKKTDKSATDSKFPKPHSDITTKHPFWGFMESKEDMENICSETDCTGNKTSSFFEGYWVWKGGSGGRAKKLKDWSSNDLSSDESSWWNNVYTKTEWDMSKVVENLTGHWSLKVWYGIDRPKVS